MAAVLSADMDKTDKIVTLIDECAEDEPQGGSARRERIGVCIQGPGPVSIRFGIGAIKGVGASAVQAIVQERDARGPYQSLPDLAAASICSGSIAACSRLSSGPGA